MGDHGEQREHHDGVGPPPVIERASDPAGRAALRHQADILGRLRHPGVVRLLGHHTAPDADALITERVPGGDLGTEPPTTAAAIARRAAGVAAVLGDLHDLGIAHGAIEATHVLVDGDRVVLRAFAAAGDATDDARERDVVDLCRMTIGWLDAAPGSPGRSERRARAALRALLESSVAEPVAASDLARRLAGLGPLPVGADQVTSVDIADDRLDGDRRPVRSWRERVMPLPSAVDPVPTAGARRRRSMVTGAGLGLAGLVTWAVLMGETGTDPSMVAPAPTPVDDVRADEEPSVDATDRAGTSGEATPTAPIPDPRPVIEAAGHLVAVDGVWFRLGTPGDIARAGDWDCDGRPTAVLLRPSVGRVFVFDRWSDTGETIVPAAELMVPGAVDIVVDADRAGCAALLAIDDRGRRSPVAVQS